MSSKLAHPRVLLALAAALLLGACASTPSTSTGASSSDGSKEALKQRATERWEFLIAHDAAKAWEYLTPGYRATITAEKYGNQMNSRPAQWKSAKITKIDCAQPGNCQVYVAVTYSLVMGIGGSGPVTTFAPLKETWLFLHNQWYYLPSEEG